MIAQAGKNLTPAGVEINQEMSPILKGLLNNKKLIKIF